MAGMVFVYKMLHNMCDNKLEDVGLSLFAGNERSGKKRLYQHRARNRQSGTSFKYMIYLHNRTNCRHVSLLLRR